MSKLRFSLLSACLAVGLLTTEQLAAFCGFYVAKADASLFNNTSEVILVRNGDRSVVTMKSDFQGDVSEFAMVVPVPTVLKERDIRTVDHKLFQTLNDYSAPRLVEYYDEHPCVAYEAFEMSGNFPSRAYMAASRVEMDDAADKYQVKIEAEYQVGEYDILILSAKDSKGLKHWLTDNGYRIPAQAHEVLDPYIRNQLKFFVVKVNETAYRNLGSRGLSPVQIEYTSDRFMLPIRLGMANANGTQDMVVYGLSPKGRIECTNYRQVDMPTGTQIPLFVKPDFGDFYVDVFDRQYAAQGRNAVFLEYAWNVSPSWGGMKCDPCIGPPPIINDLVTAGCDWLGNGQNLVQNGAYFTRLHVRYDRKNFPQDLQFQVTPNKEHYQARYVLTHSASGPFDCSSAQTYLHDQRNRRIEEVDNLEILAGWSHHKANRYIAALDQYMEQPPKDKRRGEVIAPPQPSDRNRPGTGILVLMAFFALLLTLKLMTRSAPALAG